VKRQATGGADVIAHLYIHIPFCPKVCPYCSFYKEASDRNRTQPFLDAVLRELDLRLGEFAVRPRTIFFGGGTPSALSTRQLEFLLGGLRDRLDLSGLVEWTLEMNPATVSLEKAAALRALGVNRVSMGVQSWEPGLLEVLGRVHTAGQAQRSFEILREAGIPAINLDLIFGIPGQTDAQWVDSLTRTASLQPDHISAYCLTYEEDTEFFLRRNRGEFRPDIELDARFFETAMDRLGDAGFLQYEISNYAPPGRECLHNLAYWEGRDYLGLGPSAFSTVGERRWQNIPDTEGYIARIGAGGHAESFVEAVPPELRDAERIAFGLRTRFGVEAALLGRHREAVAGFARMGLMEPLLGSRWGLTRRGRMVADSVAEAFV
jgi:oxygen-independent coproporphyrinogen-3 oxidase